jgi:general nucleoside transport system ATP-binding protein
LALNGLLTRREPVRRWGWLDRALLRQQAERIVQRYGVKAESSAAPASSLSGGNLQKFVLGREIDGQPKLLLLAQPTWGVDVGAAAQIRRELLGLRDTGCALLVASEELEELFQISDALVVMSGGRLSPRLTREEASVERIGEWMGGSWPEPAAEPTSAAAAVPLV